VSVFVCVCVCVCVCVYVCVCECMCVHYVCLHFFFLYQHPCDKVNTTNPTGAANLCQHHWLQKQQAHARSLPHAAHGPHRLAQSGARSIHSVCVCVCVCVCVYLIMRCVLLPYVIDMHAFLRV